MVYEQKLQFLELIQPFSYSKTDPDRQLAKLRYQSGITSANEVKTRLIARGNPGRSGESARRRAGEGSTRALAR